MDGRYIPTTDANIVPRLSHEIAIIFTILHSLMNRKPTTTTQAELQNTVCGK